MLLECGKTSLAWPKNTHYRCSKKVPVLCKYTFSSSEFSVSSHSANYSKNINKGVLAKQEGDKRIY